MLYLEDFIELIEHLPEEVRDKLHEIKDIDSKVENSLELLDNKSEIFFSKAKKLKPEDREKEYERLTKEYKKLEEDSQEKIDISDRMLQLFNKHLKKLDQELYKFKMELEADNAGITEVLEKRSLELDVNSTNNGNDYHGGVKLANMNKPFNGRHHQFVFPHKNKSLVSNLVSNATKRINQLHKDRKLMIANNVVTKRRIICNYNPLVSRGLKRDLSTEKGHIQQNSNMLFINDKQAIFDDERISSPSRYSSSSRDKFANELERIPRLDRVRSRAVSKKLLPGPNGINNPENPSKRSHSNSSNSNNPRKRAATNYPEFIDPQTLNSPLEDYEVDLEEEDEDPDEPRYCICNQVSYGEMVACDNPSCPYEWFHYACVGITQPPKGKWFCPECSITAVF